MRSELITSRRPVLLAGPALAAIAVLHLATVSHTPGTIDSAKFAFVGKVFGVGHATGYPLYLAGLGVFSRLLPLGEPAFRANTFGAVCIVVGLWALARILVTLGASRPAVNLAVLVTGVMPLVWTQSMWAEVYAPAWALFGLWVSCAVVALVERDRRNLRAACWWFALSFGVHLWASTLIPLMVGLAVAWWFRRPEAPPTPATRLAGPRGDIVHGVAAAVVGVAVYLYLPLAVAWRPLYLELEVHSFDDFLYVVRGAQFQGLMGKLGWEEVRDERGPFLLDLLWRQFGWWALLVVIGAVRRWRAALVVTALLLPNLWFIATYGISDIDAYTLPLLFVLAVGLGLGLDALLSAAAALIERLELDRRAIAAVVALLCLPMLGSVLEFGAGDRRAENDAAHESVRAQLALVPNRAVVLGVTGSFPEYTAFERYAYELIGRGEGRRRSIWLANDWNPTEVDAFLRGGDPIRSELGRYRLRHAGQQLIDPPTEGARIYLMAPSGVAGLEAAGLQVTAVPGVEGLWRVGLREAVRGPAATAAAPGGTAGA